nr:MAG TPA: hypothetical protein [Caudoviricetes sp.]
MAMGFGKLGSCATYFQMVETPRLRVAATWRTSSIKTPSCGGGGVKSLRFIIGLLKFGSSIFIPRRHVTWRNRCRHKGQHPFPLGFVPLVAIPQEQFEIVEPIQVVNDRRDVRGDHARLALGVREPVHISVSKRQVSERLSRGVL